MKFSVKSQNVQTILNLSSGILTMIIQLIVNFFLSSYIVRTLGEEANGFTQLANNFVTYATLITLAFNSMSGRFISVSYHQKQKKEVIRYYSTTYICNIIIGFALICTSFVFIINLDKIIRIENASHNDIQLLFVFVFLNFIINLFISLYSTALFVKNCVYIQNIVNLARTVLNALLLLLIFTILPPKMYYVSFVTLFLTLLCIPFFWKIQLKKMPELKLKVSYFSFNALKKMIKSGIWNTINQCGNMLMTGLDLLITNTLISPTLMGVLSIAKTIPNTILSLAGVINASFAPALVRDWASGENEKILSQLRNSMKISSVIISIPIITFSCFSLEFYSLWMPTLDAKMLAILSLLSCMAYIPCAGIQNLYNVYTASNKLSINSITFVFGGILNIALVFILLNTTDFGVYAVASVSSIITIMRNLIVTVPYTARILNFKWYEFYKDILISLCCCGINFIVAYVVRSLMRSDTWLHLFIAVSGTVVFTLILDMICILSKNERNAVILKIRRMFHGNH